MMNNLAILAVCLVTISVGQSAIAAPQHDDSATNSRGEHVMGFDQHKTTHHFVLTKSGGIIQVTANDATDTTSQDHIRIHLQHISKAFAEGDFTDPHDVHAETPPGVPVMKARRNKLSYRFDSIPSGGKVVIKTEDPKALDAVHEYLQYQIREHKTGDSAEVQ
jgi:hypothetical protein